MLNLNLKYVTLIATEGCNLSCTYCYEANKSKRNFDVEETKKIIERELMVDDGFDAVSFEFFGGEPFLEFEKIKLIVEWFKGKSYPKRFSFFAGTNGTLLDDSTKKWLLENKDIFFLGLSLDGTKEMHDINRSNSFDLIDIPFFVQNYDNLVVKMTVSQETLPSLYEGVKFCHDVGFHAIRCNLAQGIDWTKKDNESILETELDKLIQFYLENPTLTVCSLLDYQLQNISFDLNGRIVKFCGAGTRMKVYDVTGEEYPCQYFLPLSIGDKSLDTKKIKFSDFIEIKDLDEMCQTCVGVSVCPSCYGANFAATGNIHGRDVSFCKLTKTIIKANSFFKARQWELGQLKNMEKKDLKLLLNAILKIQNEL